MFAGMQMQIIARATLAYELTGSNAALGGVMFGFAIPMLLLSLWGGVVADRFPKRNLLIVAQSTIALSAVVMATLVATDLAEYWMLIAASAVQGACFSFIGPARMAFTGDIIGRDKMANAVALQQLSMRSTQVIGPATAGFLISVAFIGIGGVYYVTAVMFVAGVLTMTTLPAGNPQPRLKEQSPVADLVDGLRYVVARRDISVLILTSFVVVALGFPFQSFLVAVSEDVFHKGSSGFGLLSSATAMGAIVSTVLVATFAGHPRAWLGQISLGLSMGLGLIFLGLTPSFLLAVLVTMPFLGAASSGFQSLNASIIMTITDQEFQGRVQSLSSLAFSLSGLAALPVGVLADQIGLMNTFVVLGLVMIGGVLAINAAGLLTGLRMRRLAAAERAGKAMTVPPGGGSA